MVPGDPEEGFKVTDRRRRDDTAPITTSTGDAVKPPPDAKPQEAARSGPRDVSVGGDAPERSLIGLFMMLGSSALVALGDAPEPGLGQAQPNPQEAAALVDLLVLLREKTEGNRTPEESEVLGELIYDLQVRYINLTRQLTNPPKPRN
jgi:hypothetical protein